jgi:hypothetical protein
MPEAVEPSIHVHLTKAQALVLFEFLARETENEQDKLTLADPAELQVLWIVEGQLEKVLVGLFEPNYTERLLKARAEVVSEE